MQKITLTNEDGSTVEFFPQAHVDNAVQEALAASSTATTDTTTAAA